MSIRWENSLSAGLARFRADVAENLDDALVEGAQVIMDDAIERTPKESGDLAASGRVRANRGGSHTVGLTFDGPYARWIHEHLYFRHPRGGQAKFLETAMTVKAKAAFDEAVRALWRRV